MVIYTPLPLESVLEGIEDLSDVKFIEIDGKWLEYKEINDKKKELIRLISSDPNDYLNPVFTPGRIF
jgi:ABC-type antimicrobial peptide transport system ATPase subunit